MLGVIRFSYLNRRISDPETRIDNANMNPNQCQELDAIGGPFDGTRIEVTRESWHIAKIVGNFSIDCEGHYSEMSMDDIAAQIKEHGSKIEKLAVYTLEFNNGYAFWRFYAEVTVAEYHELTSIQQSKWPGVLTRD